MLGNNMPTAVGSSCHIQQHPDVSDYLMNAGTDGAVLETYQQHSFTARGSSSVRQQPVDSSSETDGYSTECSNVEDEELEGEVEATTGKGRSGNLTTLRSTTGNTAPGPLPQARSSPGSGSSGAGSKPRWRRPLRRQREHEARDDDVLRLSRFMSEARLNVVAREAAIASLPLLPGARQHSMPGSVPGSFSNDVAHVASLAGTLQPPLQAPPGLVPSTCAGRSAPAAAHAGDGGPHPANYPSCQQPAAGPAPGLQ
mmetsp:Transcript_33256/g.73556  ORF Transcript_33256/g.73556 Transcript_33256/m.73556 type:complete len:255 (-) Transcript_33256:428-1192(-)